MQEEEQLIFLNRDKDILGNINYSQYCICKNNNELIIKFEKKSATNKMYKVEFTIESIQSIKNSSTGNIVLPNFISQGDMLVGTYKEGFTFTFKNVFSMRIMKEEESCIDNDKNKKKN